MKKFISILLCVLYLSGCVSLRDDGNSNTDNNSKIGYFTHGIVEFETDIVFALPENWYYEPRINNGEKHPYLPISNDMEYLYDIYNDDGDNIGAFVVWKYKKYEYAENNPMAIYGAVALPNMHHFEVATENYQIVSTRDYGTVATTLVYHSPSLVHNNGGLGEPVYNKGILAHNDQVLVTVAFEFDSNIEDTELLKISDSIMMVEASDSIIYHNSFTTATREEIANFISDESKTEVLYAIAQTYGYTTKEIEKLYVNAPWNVLALTTDEMLNNQKMETVFNMFISDNIETEVRSWVLEQLQITFPEEMVRTLLQLSYDSIEIYFWSEYKVYDIVDELKISNNPGGANRMLMYEELASQLFESYKTNSITYDSNFAKAPEDFVYPEMIHWGEIKFVQDETGYFNVNIPSADGKYNMIISIGDFTFNSEMPFDSTPMVNYVAFVEN